MLGHVYIQVQNDGWTENAGMDLDGAMSTPAISATPK